MQSCYHYDDDFDADDDDDLYDLKRSMGKGNMMVEFFSAEIEFNVCRYRSWRFKTSIFASFKHHHMDHQNHHKASSS